MQRAEHVESVEIAVGVVARGKAPGFCTRLAAGDIGHELKQGVRRRAERAVGHQFFAQRLAGDLGIRPRAQERDHGVDEARIVLRDDAERIADDVVEAAFREIELDVPSLLFRAGAIELSAGQEGGERGILAATALRNRFRSWCGPGRNGGGGGPGLLHQCLDLAQRFLAARRAEIEPPFGA